MTRETCSVSGLQIEEVSDVRGIGARRTLRMTRTDMASVLLHEIDAGTAQQLRDAEFSTRLPNFNRPFISRIAGLAAYGGSAFLIEPLPGCVPLLDVWRTVLREEPARLIAALDGVVAQLNLILSGLNSDDLQYSAVCAENVVLTTRGVYGLLTARIRCGGEWLWLRPVHSHPVDTTSDHSGLSSGAQSPNQVKRYLARFAMENGVPSRLRSELDSIAHG
ncbi:MAG: hypothetical protein O7D91_04940 [Planctomycetota bacterium]|nr:hypothetical protein [Planctomycetota bacterium]